MQCCNDKTKTKDQSFRVTIQQSKQQQPLKLQLLSAIGLKDYVVQKFIFNHVEPTYQVIDENGIKYFDCQGGIDQLPEYDTQVTIIQDEKHSIPTVMLSLKDRSKYSGTIVYSHGNGSDLKAALKFITAFASKIPKFDFLAYDYTGYGRSNRSQTTQKSICEDLQLILRSIRVPDQEIILWGFSLGAYPTVKAAKNRKLKGVLLQSPMASVHSFFTEKLTPYSSFERDSFSLLEHLPAVNSFLVIAHSRSDQTVPFIHGKTLFQRYQMINPNPFCFLLEVDGLAHNQMHSLLCSPNKNQLRDGFHNYLKLMCQQGQLPMVRVFQLQKNKYFSNLGQIQDAQLIDTTDKNTIDESAQVPPPRLPAQSSLTELRGDRLFEMDDVSNEQVVELNYYMHVKADHHAEYFHHSQQAKDETEVQSIPSEQNIPDILE